MKYTPSPVGLTAVDLFGAIAGRIDATYPLDSREPEFAVVRLASQGFGETRMVPLAGALRFDHCVQFTCTYSEMLDAPSPQHFRWADEQADHSRAYWPAIAV